MTDQKRSGEPDPVIVAMLKRIPPAGSVWPLAERSEWIQAMYGIFDMVYGPADRVELVVTVSADPNRRAELLDTLRTMPPGRIESSAEPTDEAMARDVVVASGSGNVAAETTEAPAKPGVGSERSSSAEADPPRKNVGGAPSKSGRPLDMPSNLVVVRAALRELGGRAAAAQIRTWARNKYWPEMPDHWASVLYQFVTSGDLERAGMDFKLPEPKQEVVKHVPKMPTVAPPKPAPALRAFTFKHGDKSVMFATAQQLALAHRLQQANGQHVGEAFLAEKILGANTERHRDTIKMQALGLNGPLFELGLKVTHYPGFGLSMKEVE